MQNRLFITATDTDAGKTYVTTALTRALREANRDMIALKPVACGNDGKQLNPDVAALLNIQGLSDEASAGINLYSFNAPLAPSQAAAKEDRRIDPQRLTDWCMERSMEHDICLLEGVGGLMVPLVKGFLVLDWLAQMPDFDVVLVVRVRLGGINQALLTLDKLNQIGRSPVRIIINDADNAGEAMLASHFEAIGQFSSLAAPGILEILKYNEIPC